MFCMAEMLRPNPRDQFRDRDYRPGDRHGNVEPAFRWLDSGFRVACLLLAVGMALAGESSLTVCGDTPAAVRKGIAAIRGGRAAPVHCEEGAACCAPVSIVRPKAGAASQNLRTWSELSTLPQKTTVFVQKPATIFCASITTVTGETIPAPFVGRPSLTQEEVTQILLGLFNTFGREQGGQYAAYEPRVGPSLPGQTLIPCGVPNDPCSCSGEMQIHVWDDDPALAATLAHEATHAWLYYRQRPFGHGEADVDKLTRNAEREATPVQR